MISMNGAKSLHLNPKGDMLAFTAMISWGFYSAIIKKIGEWDVTVFKKPEIILNFLFLGVGASALGFFLWIFLPMDRCDQDECIYLCVTGCDGCAICGDTA